MIQAAILGASGYVGAELLRLLAGHPGIRAARLFAGERAGDEVAAVHPQLALAYPGMRFDSFAPEMLANVDLVFAALPHGHSQRVAADILDRGLKFVDLGADFRLDSAGDYQRWYGEAHQAPDLLGRFTYGLPELHRHAIREASAVAAPGCYPTAANLALHPLRELIEGTIIVDAASGVTGAGRAAKEATHFSTVAESFAAYGLLNHRHTAEIEMELGRQVLFTPHLAPMNRGILATCYGRAKAPCDPLQALREAYTDEPFVQVTDQPPATKWTHGTNAAQLTARYDERTGMILAIGAIDNLGKGAAGQMIQCANLMLRLDETAGLARAGVCP